MPDCDVPVALSDGYSITSLGITVASANEVPAGTGRADLSSRIDDYLYGKDS
jgi:hypothetical protein